VFPIAEAVSEEFQLGERGAVRVTVGLSGAGGGFKKLCRGDADISNASGPILTEEMEACRTAGVEFIELPVAFDAITVVVNPKNDWVKSTVTDVTYQPLSRPLFFYVNAAAAKRPEIRKFIEFYLTEGPEFAEQVLRRCPIRRRKRRSRIFRTAASGQSSAASQRWASPSKNCWSGTRSFRRGGPGISTEEPDDPRHLNLLRLTPRVPRAPRRACSLTSLSSLTSSRRPSSRPRAPRPGCPAARNCLRGRRTRRSARRSGETDTLRSTAR
jgi:PBP superfamily domain